MKIFIILACVVAACAAGSLPKLWDIFPGKIVGGYPVDITDFPYQLQMERNGRFICGASIYNSKTVLTAAHCVDGTSAGSVAVRAGSDRLGSGGTVHRAQRLIVHPNYNPDTIDYDVALIIVTYPFSNSSTTQPIALGSSTPSAGSNCTVSGFGTTTEGGSLPSELLAVSVPVVDHNTCDRAYAAYGGITARMLCAGQGGKDSCQGDSGGPLVQGGEQVGIVSWGVGCAQPRYPGVYTEVASVKSWIENNAA